MASGLLVSSALQDVVVVRDTVTSSEKNHWEGL